MLTVPTYYPRRAFAPEPYLLVMVHLLRERLWLLDEMLSGPRDRCHPACEDIHREAFEKLEAERAGLAPRLDEARREARRAGLM